MPGEIEHESIFSKLREALKKGFRAIFHPVEMLTYRMLGGKDLYNEVVREEFKLGEADVKRKEEQQAQKNLEKTKGTRVMCPLGDKAYVEGVVTGAHMKNVDGQNLTYLTVAMPNGEKTDFLAKDTITKKQLDNLNKKLDDKQKFEVITLNDYEQNPQTKRRYTTLNKQAQKATDTNEEPKVSEPEKGKKSAVQVGAPNDKTGVKRDNKKTTVDVKKSTTQDKNTQTGEKGKTTGENDKKKKEDRQNKSTKDIEVSGFKKGDEVYDQKSGTYGVITTITPLGFATIKPDSGPEVMAEVGNLMHDPSKDILNGKYEIVEGPAETVDKAAIDGSSNEKPKKLIDSRENIEQGSVVIVNKSSNFRKPMLVECTVTNIKDNGSLVLEPNVKDQNLGGTFTMPRNKAYGVSEISKDDALYNAVTDAKGISSACKNEIYASNVVDLDVTYDDTESVTVASLENQIDEIVDSDEVEVSGTTNSPINNDLANKPRNNGLDR